MKAVVFDVDGTLVDSMEFWNNLARNYLLSLNIEARENLNSMLQTLTVDKGVLYIKEEYGIEKTVEAMRDEIDLMILKFYSEEVQLNPYVLELLELLKEKDVKMAIATLTEENHIEAMLGRLGIRERFDFIQTPTNSGIGKDDIAFYNLLSDRLGIDISSITFFEDSLYAMIPAKETGMKIVGVEDKASFEDKEEIRELVDIYIKDFSEVVDLLEK